MKWSNSFIPTLKEIPADTEAVSHQLMIRGGLIRMLTSGVYSYLPLGLGALQKVESIIREEMNREGARELLLPALQPAELWQTTGRYETLGEDMISFKDRHGKLNVLGPTHEEVITLLVKGEVKSYRQLPLILFQIQTKFRDEARPRFGVIRSREFIMKDAYSFDADETSLSESYEKMLGAYQRIFARCGLETWIVEADPGFMGGNRSHEFVVPAESGESAVGRCEACQTLWPLSEELSAQGRRETVCPNCHKGVPVRRGLEVGHIFQLGTKYTSPLEATYLDREGKRRPILMGCYGIGVTRILAAVIEQHHDENGILWPESVAPFQLLILPLLSDETCLRIGEEIYSEAVAEGWEVLLDDRDERAGVKFKDADLIGIPFQVIVGQTALKEAKFEIKRRKDGKTWTVSRPELLGTLKELYASSSRETGKVSPAEALREIISGLLEKRGVELVDFTYRREGSRNVLRILADTPGGISLNVCAELNRLIGELLDEKKLIQESYVLEVSSPGLDRPLLTARDFKRVIGKEVRLLFKRPLSGRTDVQGVLEDVKEDLLLLRFGGETLKFSLKDLSRGERIVTF